VPSLPVALSDCACVLSSRLPCQEIASPCTHPWPLTSPTPSHTPPPPTHTPGACLYAGCALHPPLQLPSLDGYDSAGRPQPVSSQHSAHGGLGCTGEGDSVDTGLLAKHGCLTYAAPTCQAV
jgi:hypothetical protein